MQRVALGFLAKAARAFSLVLLAVVGTTLLTRFAPGYFADARELDAAHSSRVEAVILHMRATQGSPLALLTSQLRLLLHGDLGTSRHFELPVRVLVAERAAASARLLAAGTCCGWAIALLLAILLSSRQTRRGETLISAGSALILAVPMGALATFCLLANIAGPVLVLALLVAIRDFKILYGILRGSWQAPHIFYAKAQGYTVRQTVTAHILSPLRGEFLALGITSFTLALSALVPVEVIFDVPGLGQLAWNAAMNRDLPVLIAVTAVLATCVAIAGLFTAKNRAYEEGLCA